MELINIVAAVIGGAVVAVVALWPIWLPICIIKIFQEQSK